MNVAETAAMKMEERNERRARKVCLTVQQSCKRQQAPDVGLTVSVIGEERAVGNFSLRTVWLQTARYELRHLGSGGKRKGREQSSYLQSFL